MNIIPQDRQVAVISALVEGCSIRTTERLTETHRDTVMRLGARIGRGCIAMYVAPTFCIFSLTSAKTCVAQ